MKRLLIAMFLFLSAVEISAQEPKARMVDEFGRVPCGDMMARLDVLLGEWMKNTEERVAVVYYNHRYRRHSRLGKDGKPETTILNFPHPDDAKNLAEGVPIYLSDRLGPWIEQGTPSTVRERLLKNVVLVDGGYREKIWTEIWLVPRGASYPVPQPQLKESDIRFGAKTPYRVPRYSLCYEGVG